jgi:hypothetical protein
MSRVITNITAVLKQVSPENEVDGFYFHATLVVKGDEYPITLVTRNCLSPQEAFQQLLKVLPAVP